MSFCPLQLWRFRKTEGEEGNGEGQILNPEGAELGGKGAISEQIIAREERGRSGGEGVKM